jgi:hypothetical protein
MQHRGIDFEVKQCGSSTQWRWIVYRRQPQGAVALGMIEGTSEDAIAACKCEIDQGLAFGRPARGPASAHPRPLNFHIAKSVA